MHAALCSQVLLKLGADPNAQADGDLWECPLHAAVRGRFTACVKLLLDYGADINAPTQFLETPLHVAAQVGSKQKRAGMRLLGT